MKEILTLSNGVGDGGQTCQGEEVGKGRDRERAREEGGKKHHVNKLRTSPERGRKANIY